MLRGNPADFGLSCSADATATVPAIRWWKIAPDAIVAQLTGAALALAFGATVAGAEEAKLQLMFVQSSAGSTADPDAQTLRLTDVTPQALYFSDRPERVAGHIPMDDCPSYWREGADNFGEDPPNATLSVYEPGSTRTRLSSSSSSSRASKATTSSTDTI